MYIMKRLAIVMTLVVATTSVLLSGCEPFPSDVPVSSPAADKPTKTPEQAKAPAVNTPTTSGTEKQSDASPTTSTTTSTSVDEAPVVEQKEVQSTSSENTPVAKPEEPEPAEVQQEESEDDSPQLAPNAGKLQIIGTSGKDVYYMKKVEQPDANCYVVSNSVTWDTSVSCVPAVNVHMKKEQVPPVTTVTTGK